MNELMPSSASAPFDAIRKTDAEGNYYWSARDLQPTLDYDSWRRFEDAVDRARISCKTAGYDPSDHFADAVKVIKVSDLIYAWETAPSGGESS